MKNDWRDVLVYCGRNVEEERCAGKKSKMKNKVRSSVQIGVKKKVVKKKVVKKKVVKKKPVLDSGEGTSQSPKNPNSWSRAFFEMDRRCAAFENGISESFNRVILEPRHKPIITMLEEIREWMVIPSGFQELEVRKDDQSYGVNLQHKVIVHLGAGVEVEVKMKPVVAEWVVLMKLVVEGDEVLEEEVEGDYQLQLDKEAYRECMEEQVREQAKNDVEQERSERIANMKLKKASEFDNHGTCSIPDKAFDVSD
nr:hypothetical protein [Tanacetum cinerariifolium]